MSVYALPGFLFPPIEPDPSTSISSFAFASSTSNQTEQQQNETTKSMPLSSSSTIPLELQRQRKPQQHRTDRQQYTIDDNSDPDPDSSEYSEGPVLKVTQAKLDPVLLVKGLTRCATKAASKTLYPSSSSSHRKPSSSTTPRRKSRYEDAIQFELSVKFNGRKYTATRTFPSIIQLRNDLIREMRSRKAARHKHYRKQQQHENQQQQRQKQYHDQAGTDQDAVSNCSSSDEEDEVLIPELPPFSEDDSASQGENNNNNNHNKNPIPHTRAVDGYVASTAPSTVTTVASTSLSYMASGFTMLHAFVKSYCPMLERWLRHIIRLAPDSPTLAKFLWEPLCGQLIIPMPIQRRSGSNQRLSSSNLASSLTSIQELVEAESCDEDIVDEEDCVEKDTFESEGEEKSEKLTEFDSI